MRNLALRRIQKMKAYSPPLEGRAEFEGLLLDFNERLVPPEKAGEALKKWLDKSKLQVYPEYLDLEKKIADYAGVKADQVLLTNGSTEGIDIIFKTFTEKGDRVIIPSPSFALFYQFAQIMGNRIITPFYSEDDLLFPLAEVLASINNRVKLIIICNPNNPTGTLLPISGVEAIAGKAPQAVIYLDEAYYEFSRVSAVELMQKYPNIVISRTFSKAFGLASLRIGYCLASSEHIAEMKKVRGPYDINMAAYCAAYSVLEDRRDMEKYVKEITGKARPLLEKFFAENAIPFYPSQANFILFRNNNAERTSRLLAQGGVLVRPQHARNLKNALRLSIGTENQMQEFIEIYKSTILKNEKQKIAFLDRDGTLIFEPQDDYQVDSLQKLKILDGVIDGLKRLKEIGYTLVMITNQDGLGTSVFPRHSFEVANQEMLRILRGSGIEFDRIFICPHLPENKCNCRKPNTGLVDEFLRNENIDKGLSFVCGDRESDRGLAQNIGIRFIPQKTNANFYEAIKPVLENL